MLPPEVPGQSSLGPPAPPRPRGRSTGQRRPRARGPQPPPGRPERCASSALPWDVWDSEIKSPLRLLSTRRMRGRSTTRAVPPPRGLAPGCTERTRTRRIGVLTGRALSSSPVRQDILNTHLGSGSTDETKHLPNYIFIKEQRPPHTPSMLSHHDCVIFPPLFPGCPGARLSRHPRPC